MPGVSSRLYPAEFAVMHGLAPSSLYTDCLQQNPSVALPLRQHADNFTPEIIAAFEHFADGFDRTFGSNDLYPNAKLLPAFMPARSGRPGLALMGAWGEKTDFPLSHGHNASKYFNYFERNFATSNEILKKTTLDAKGFLGHLRKVGKDIGLTVLYNGFNLVEYKSSIGRATLSAYEVYDTVGQSGGHLLRFLASIRYIPGNGYLGIDFERGDQSRLVSEVIEYNAWHS